MVDVTSLALLAASFFFVVVAAALLIRYKEVSERINASTDLGKDLWSSLEQRLRKQDERILDMMGRVDVIQSRVMASSPAQPSPSTVVLPSGGPVAPQSDSKADAGHKATSLAQQPESQESRTSQVPAPSRVAPTELDETQLAALRLLAEAPKNTRQLTDALAKSREHTARVMKALFESGLVQRNDASKPFVYELTDEGRSRLPVV